MLRLKRFVNYLKRNSRRLVSCSDQMVQKYHYHGAAELLQELLAKQLLLHFQEIPKAVKEGMSALMPKLIPHLIKIAKVKVEENCKI